MSTRTRLPNRRWQITTDLDFEGVPLRVSVGFDASGAVKEVFVSADREG